MSVRNNVKLLAWLNFFGDFRFYSAIAILYFKEVSGTYALGMSVFAINYVSSSFFEIPTGVLSDKIGRCKTIVLGTISILLGTILYAIASNYYHLVFGSILCGLGYAFFSGNNDALLYETLKGSDRRNDYHHMLGKISSMSQFALSISALMGGFVAQWSFKWTMWLSVISAVACFCISLFFVEPKIVRTDCSYYRVLKEACRQFVSNGKLRSLSIANICHTSIGDAIHFLQISLFAMLIPIWGLGIFRSASNSMGAVSFWFSGRVINRLGYTRVLIGGIALTIVIQIVAFVINSPITPVLIVFVAIFYGAIVTSKNTLQQFEFTDEQRSTMGSLISFWGNIVFGVVSTTMGLLADHIGLVRTLLIAVCAKLIVIFMYERLFRTGTALKANNLNT